MTAYLITCMIIIVLLTLVGQAGGFLAGLMISVVLAPFWWVAWAIVSDDSCDDTTYGTAHYNTC